MKGSGSGEKFSVSQPCLTNFAPCKDTYSNRCACAGAADSERSSRGAAEEEGARHEPESGPLQVLCAEHVPRHPRAGAGLPLSKGKKISRFRTVLWILNYFCRIRFFRKCRIRIRFRIRPNLSVKM